MALSSATKHKGTKQDKGNAKAKKAKKAKLSLKERVLKAMVHPLRVHILAYMNDRPWSPSELSDQFEEGLSQISYHVKVLKDLELIELTTTEPRRGAVEHYYRALERVFVPSTITKQFPRSAQRSMYMDTLEDANMDLVASIKSGRFDERPDYHVSYTPVYLDDIACGKAEKLADKFVEDFISLSEESANRCANGKNDDVRIPTSATVIVFGSETGEKEKAASRKPAPKKAQSKEKKPNC